MGNIKNRRLEIVKSDKWSVLLVVGTLTAVAQAESEGGGAGAFAKSLLPYEGLLTKGCVGLLVLFLGLLAWEFVEQKRASRSSLDIAKLAAAAAKKKASTTAPASGSLTPAEPPAPPGRSFAPPPPPPPPVPQERNSGLGAEPASSSDNPFAPAAPITTDMGFGSQDGNMPAVDSTVGFEPPDAGSSGGWADLLQRVRAGEPEAASFGEDSPLPSTELESAKSFEAPSSPESSVLSLAESPPLAASAGEPSGSSEAWEALLKRTTDNSDGASPDQSLGKIGMERNPLPGSTDSPPPALSVSTGSVEPPGFSMPALAHSADMNQSEDSGSGFQLPGSSPAVPASGFSLPGASSESSGSPTFKLPGGAADASPGGGFKLGSQGGSPFGGGSGGQIDDAGSTMALTDMFSGGGSGDSPSFQLPSIGTQQGGANPFDFSGGGPGGDASAGRTISLDFSQGAGQIPPPPQPKTEG